MTDFYVLSAVLVIFVVLVLARLKSRMAALIAWIVGNITGAREGEASTENKREPTTSTEKAKGRQRAKKTSEKPAFSTNLSSPIEDIIEEIINEEVASEDQPSSSKTGREGIITQTSRKSGKRRKTGKQSQNTTEEEEIGFSFFKTRLEAEQKKIEQQKPKRKKDLNKQVNEVAPPVDELGFSFVPVKEKGGISKLKNPIEKRNSEEALKVILEQGVKKKSDLSRPSIISHYNSKKTSQSETVAAKKLASSLDKEDFVVVNRVESRIQKQEVKESKKVSSSISYAKVVTNTYLEDTALVKEQQHLKLEKAKINSDTELNKNPESIKSYIVVESCIEAIDEDQNCIHLKYDKFLSKSSSSSIKVISDTTANTEKYQIENSNSKQTEDQIVTVQDSVESTEEKSEKTLVANQTFEHFGSTVKNINNIQSEEIIHTENFVLEKENLEENHHTVVDVLNQNFEEKSHFETQILDNLIKNKNRENSSETEDFTVNTLAETEKSSEQYIIQNNSSERQVVINGNYVEEITEQHTIEKEGTFQRAERIAEESENNSTFYSNQEIEISFTKSTENLIVTDNFIKSETEASSPLEATEALGTDSQEIPTMTQTRILTLNDKEHQESTIYRIEKSWVIQFRLGPSLLGRNVKLFCNYPEEVHGKLSEFNRAKYTLLKWVQDEGCKNSDDTALFTQITAQISGSFHYYFVYENEKTQERQGSGYFLIDPVLKYGNNEDLPLDCIQCQTVLAKGLGPFSSWERKLQVAKESGYNMIHFTPIQKLGVSNSCYSLSEQLQLNDLFDEENGKKPTFEDVEKLISTIRKDWKVTSICDIVLNHTANESEWLKEHPEVTYNCVNCPYMRPAYLLDSAFHQFSMDVKKGLYEDRGIPVEVSTEDHLNAIRYHFKVSVLDPLNIAELYIIDTNKYLTEFLELARKVPPVVSSNVKLEQLTIIQDPEYRRLASRVDITLALKLYNVYRSDCFDEEARIKRCAEEFKNIVDSLNKVIIDQVTDHLRNAVENVIAGIRYFRVQADGPRVKEITIKNPLVFRYFTDHGSPRSLKEHEEIMYGINGRFLMAHNGWVMNSDPLKNFADPDSHVYLRRELIAWGDSVKLRFGNKPEDCPFLWNHFKKYVEKTARIFDGVRLDNCHSTPIAVAEYLLDCARRVKPNLYVVAELFTNSDMTDNIFVNRLGITSLIREAMSAWDSHEEGRLVYRYGGCPVGSFYQPSIRPLVPSVAHALFLDQTHDNPSPVEKRSVFDLLPSTALVNMACCASGSNRGYDELVPHHIHVVDETRQYAEWIEDESLAVGNARYVTKNSGIVDAKRALNRLHFELGKEGFNQVYVDQMDADIVAVTRHNPETHQSFVLVAFTAFGHPDINAGNHQRNIKPLRIEGLVEEIVLEASLCHISAKSGGSKYAKYEKFVHDSKWINGLSEYQVNLKEHIPVSASDMLEEVDSGTVNVTQLNFKHFKPGSVVVVKVSLPEDMKEAVEKVRKLINKFSIKKNTELRQIVNGMTLADLNRAVYRCDQEERDEGFGFGTYDIPNFGPMVYSGLQGFMSLLANIRPSNDLGHPMCGNLRDGNWMIDYIWKRLKLDEGTKKLGQWIEENTKCFNSIPRYLVPCYFDVVLTGMYVVLLERCYELMSDFVKNGSTFVRGLSLGSVQFGAYIKSSNLPTLSPNLAPPKPPIRKDQNGDLVQACVTLSAGLPHFSVGYMRNWGRDTFIALRGLFILTGRFQEAREHILGYAACLRHGLIPNLLDGGRNSRFNCRDAVWWWLFCIKEYAEEAPNGLDILSDKVSRIFPTDDSPPQPPGHVDQTLTEVMQEALQVHFQGLVFRERNAGRQIDEHMTDRGFNNQIGIHPETGFVFGGNEWNCGTWMDKMGSSDKAGNRGKPATPRDGSAIELIGLSKAVVSWLWKLHQEKKYPYSGVQRTQQKTGTITKWTFKQWSDRIQVNFEKFFWVNTTPVAGEIRPDLINKRGIYKDCFGATQQWTDFQLRCNFPIAMVAAPELFNAQHAWIALECAEKYLLGPLGMKTLDPDDWAYRGDYDNSNDSNDATVANGFNYHQGPEWLWPVGFFLRAKLLFAAQNGALKETLASTKVVLAKHFTELQTSPWRGLPELTNSNGSYCNDSSRTQAWSMSCVLEVLFDLQKIESKQIATN